MIPVKAGGVKIAKKDLEPKVHLLLEIPAPVTIALKNLMSQKWLVLVSSLYIV